MESATKEVDREPVAFGVGCWVLGWRSFCDRQAGPLPAANRRIIRLSNQIACATVGDRPDCYAAVAKAREYDRTYVANFGIHLSVRQIVGKTSAFFHSTHSGGGRPYGTTLFFGDYNARPQLYAIEPSGLYFGCFGCCGAS